MSAFYDFNDHLSNEGSGVDLVIFLKVFVLDLLLVMRCSRVLLGFWMQYLRLGCCSRCKKRTRQQRNHKRINRQ
jgi:hypothetical protein